MIEIATTKEQFNELQNKLNVLPEVSFRAMMGEYVVYYRGKVVGGIYDNRLLIKPVEGLNALLPQAELCIPYEGAKLLVHMQNLDKSLLTAVFGLLYEKLPEPKPKKKVQK